MPKQIVEYPYKIHALETVESCLPCSNGRYYATEEEAVERCHDYLQVPGQETSGFVIFKAIAVVRPEARPVRVNKINDDGTLGATKMVDEYAWLSPPPETDTDD